MKKDKKKIQVMTEIEFVNGKMAVELEGDYYNVHALPLDIDAIEEDEAYTHGDYVLPYRGVIPYPENVDEMDHQEVDDYLYTRMTRPGFYKMTTPTGKNILYMSPPKEDDDSYNIDKVIILDINKLVDRISSEDFLSPEAIEQLNMSSDYRKFEINPEDDFLKVIVKTIINTKKINLKIFGSRLPKRHNLANMINSLDSDTKMSVKYFMIWKELLEFDFEVSVFDDPVSIVPMKKTIRFDSISGEVSLDD